MGLSVSKLHHQLLRHKHPGAKSSFPCAKRKAYSSETRRPISIDPPSKEPHPVGSQLYYRTREKAELLYTYSLGSNRWYIQRKKKTLIMRRAAAANVDPFLYLLEAPSAHLRRVLISCCKESSRRRKVQNLVLQLSLYYRMCALWMHYKPLRRKEIYWTTLKVGGERGSGGRETEMRRAHGHRTCTFIICYGTTLRRWFASQPLQNENLFTSISNSYVGIYGPRISDG